MSVILLERVYSKVGSVGSLVQHYAYSSFGKIVKISDGSGNDITNNAAVKTSYGFTNREHDSESGMMYYRARYMIPEIGRFISEDPHPGKLNLPSTVTNKYLYVGNNPTRYVDPSGKIFGAILLGSLISGGLNAAFTKGPVLEAFGAGFLKGLGAGISIATGGYLLGGAAALFGASSGVATLFAGIGGALGSNMFAYSQGARGAGLFIATLFGFGAGLGIGASTFGGFKPGKAADYLQQSTKGVGEGLSSEGLAPSSGSLDMGATEVTQPAGIPGVGIEYPKDLCIPTKNGFQCISF